MGLMAGWSNFSNSSGSYKNVEIGLFDECEERLKILFEQALLVFLEEEGSNRPLPAVIGEGETVDLFKLFVLVREREGSDSVSRKGLWDSVAEQLGFDCSVTPSLRLVYSKYLDRMEKWAVGKSRIVSWGHQDGKEKGCYEGLLHELKDGFNGLLGNGKCGKRSRATVFGCKHVEESCSESHRHKKRFLECDLDDDDEEELGLSCVVISDESEEEDSEKEETLQGMLKWLTSVARCPHNPSIGSNECWIQVTRAKKALLVQRDNAELRFQNSTLPVCS